MLVLRATSKLTYGVLKTLILVANVRFSGVAWICYSSIVFFRINRCGEALKFAGRPLKSRPMALFAFNWQGSPWP